MDFNQIRYFLALSETLNFTRAAEQCHVSQPALTQAIKRLETELGGDLISRNKRHTELTPLGKTLRGHFQQIDQTRQLVRATAQAAADGETSELHIGLMCTIGPAVLAQLLNKFQQMHPMVSLILHDVTPEMTSTLLLSGKLDAVICTRREIESHAVAPGALSHNCLFNEPAVVAFANHHPLADQAAITLKDLTGYQYIDRLHCEMRNMVLEYCRQLSIELKIGISSQREDWIQGLINDGYGVSIIPYYSLILPSLKSRQLQDLNLSRQIVIATANREHNNAAVRSILKIAREHAWPADKF